MCFKIKGETHACQIFFLLQKEKIVSQPRSAPQAARKDAVSRDSDSDVDESLEAEQSQREIDEFEQKLKNLDGKRDVDSD